MALITWSTHANWGFLKVKAKILFALDDQVAIK